MNSRNDGLTLIELVVSMAVVVVLLGGAITAYLRFDNYQTINSDMRQLAAQVLKAQTMASGLLYPSGCENLEGVRVQSVDIGGEAVGTVITSNCTPANVAETVDHTLISSTFVGPVDITFNPGSGYLTDGATKELVINSTKDPNLTKTLVVGPYGQVSEL